MNFILPRGRRTALRTSAEIKLVSPKFVAEDRLRDENLVNFSDSACNNFRSLRDAQHCSNKPGNLRRIEEPCPVCWRGFSNSSRCDAGVVRQSKHGIRSALFSGFRNMNFRLNVTGPLSRVVKRKRARICTCVDSIVLGAIALVEALAYAKRIPPSSHKWFINHKPRRSRSAPRSLP
jgi:hypothetical protein